MAPSVTSISCLVALLAGIAPSQIQGLMIDQNKTGGVNQTSWPLVVPLDRESVPVVRNNVTISYKTSYSGLISVGKPSQDFRVVFDTGSAHVVIPSSNCKNETCLNHRRYNASNSASSLSINVDGTAVPEDELCDQVTIGYGTGMITGEFVREQVCPGGSPDACMEVSIVSAVEMSLQPFNSFNFDGIFGLALDSLALSPEFSFFHSISGDALRSGAASQFGVFLGDGEDGQRSEIALGGHSAKKTLTPLKWAPVVQADLGYWQVQIKEVRIGGKLLDICKDGSCRGIVDTGTSHLGVPGSATNLFVDQLAVHTGLDSPDCRGVAGPDLEFVLEGELTLNLTQRNYMRPLSLAIDAPATSATSVSSSLPSSLSLASDASAQSPRICMPRLMPVNLPQLGKNIFILGEPVLHQYYTVYDWGKKSIGFGVSASVANQKEHDDTTISFMQVTLKITVRGRKAVGGVPRLGAPCGI